MERKFEITARTQEWNYANINNGKVEIEFGRPKITTSTVTPMGLTAWFTTKKGEQ